MSTVLLGKEKKKMAFLRIKSDLIARAFRFCVSAAALGLILAIAGDGIREFTVNDIRNMPYASRMRHSREKAMRELQRAGIVHRDNDGAYTLDASMIELVSQVAADKGGRTSDEERARHRAWKREYRKRQRAAQPAGDETLTKVRHRHRVASMDTATDTDGHDSTIPDTSEMESRRSASRDGLDASSGRLGVSTDTSADIAMDTDGHDLAIPQSCAPLFAANDSSLDDEWLDSVSGPRATGWFDEEPLTEVRSSPTYRAGAGARARQQPIPAPEPVASDEPRPLSASEQIEIHRTAAAASPGASAPAAAPILEAGALTRSSAPPPPSGEFERGERDRSRAGSRVLVPRLGYEPGERFRKLARQLGLSEFQYQKALQDYWDKGRCDWVPRERHDQVFESFVRQAARDVRSGKERVDGSGRADSGGVGLVGVQSASEAGFELGGGRGLVGVGPSRPGADTEPRDVLANGLDRRGLETLLATRGSPEHGCPVVTGWGQCPHCDYFGAILRRFPIAVRDLWVPFDGTDYGGHFHPDNLTWLEYMHHNSDGEWLSAEQHRQAEFTVEQMVEQLRQNFRERRNSGRRFNKRFPWGFTEPPPKFYEHRPESGHERVVLGRHERRFNPSDHAGQHRARAMQRMASDPGYIEEIERDRPLLAIPGTTSPGFVVAA